MSQALEQARLAYHLNEVPVGAVLVEQGRVIASGYNQVETTQDASMHAEMIVLRQAAALKGQWRLNQTILYSTVEPCMMCMGAIFLFRVKKVVFAAKEPRFGACGSLCHLVHPIHHVEIVQGILAQEASALMKDFFKKQRKK